MKAMFGPYSGACVFCLLVCCTCTACPPSPSPPAPDASDAAALGDGAVNCSAACSNLAAIGCLEGADVDCSKSCSTGIVPKNTVACWALASSKDAARACGQIKCP